MTPFGYCMTTYVSAVSIAVSSVIPTPVKLIWNASASAPIGLYSLHSGGVLAAGDLVAVAPPLPLANRLAERGYLPRNVLLLKRVAALPGQQVCRTGRDVMIDGRFAGAALDRDRRALELPVWQGCHVIAAGEVFLMNRTVPDSLDGRYFGSITDAAIIGRAIPLYIGKAGTGHFVAPNSPIHAR
jgi:conjugative transfer signal peptidase TraF